MFSKSLILLWLQPTHAQIHWASLLWLDGRGLGLQLTSIGHLSPCLPTSPNQFAPSFQHLSINDLAHFKHNLHLTTAFYRRSQGISLDHPWPSLTSMPRQSQPGILANSMPRKSQSQRCRCPEAARCPGEGSHMVPLDGEFRSVDFRCNQQMVNLSGSRCFLGMHRKCTSFKSTRNRRVAYGCLVWDSKNLDFRSGIIAPTGLILFLLLQT